jgi:tellurite resistance protein TerC
VDIGIIAIIAQLVFLECILSIDNAAVIGAMVARLPNDRPTPWPKWLYPVFSRFDRFLGSQRESALKVGLFGAYAGRIMMLALASIIIQYAWMQVLGALYLIYLAVKHFVERFQHHQAKRANPEYEQSAKTQGFWNVVLTIELADLAFSLDNVVAAVSLSDRLWVVVLGVAIGIVIIRFGNGIYSDDCLGAGAGTRGLFVTGGDWHRVGLRTLVRDRDRRYRQVCYFNGHPGADGDRGAFVWLV